MQTTHMPDADPNPFRIAGQLLPGEMIDREEEATRLFSLAVGGHASRLVAPRRYGKTSLLRRVLADASDAGWATALDLQRGPLPLEHGRADRARVRPRAWARSGGRWTACSAPGRSGSLGAWVHRVAAVQPRIDVESVLLRLLDLPAKLHE